MSFAISLLHPTIRPEAWQAASRAWIETCESPANVQYVLVPEPGVGFGRFAPAEFPLVGDGFISLNKRGRGLPQAFNHAASVSDGRILVTIADDLWPCAGWDRILLEAVGTTEIAAVWAEVGIPHLDSQIIVHPILTRGYYEQRGGQIFHEGYTAWYADNEFSDIAMRDGVIIDARERLKFKHAHFADEVDSFHNQRGEQDRVLYEARKAAGFP